MSDHAPVFALADPVQLAKMRIASLTDGPTLFAWRVLHERPISALTPGGLTYWPCVFCSVSRKAD